MIPAILAIVVLGVLLVYQQHVHAQERDKLLNRIQAPEQAIAETLPDGPMPEAVNPESDEDYWNAREEALT